MTRQKTASVRPVLSAQQSVEGNLYIAVAQPRPVSPGVKTSINSRRAQYTSPATPGAAPRAAAAALFSPARCSGVAGRAGRPPGVRWAAGEGVGRVSGRGEVAGSRVGWVGRQALTCTELDKSISLMILWGVIAARSVAASPPRGVVRARGRTRRRRGGHTGIFAVMPLKEELRESREGRRVGA